MENKDQNQPEISFFLNQKDPEADSITLNRVAVSYFLENMEDAILLTDRIGVLQFANPAAMTLLDIDPKNMGSRKIWNYIPFVKRNDDLVQLFLNALKYGNTSQHMLVDYQNKAGEVFRFRVSIIFSRANGGSFMILFNNMTDYERAASALSRYTSPQIADMVLNAPEDQLQAGQSREITVLMSDLRGFTALSTSMPPTDLVRMLNRYFERMIQVIEAWNGCIIEFLGDGIFVVFGAPGDDPEHATHAAVCAVEMQNAMRDVNAWNMQNGFPSLSMGIGICSGPAVVGNIGSQQKMKYGCMGEPVNMAGRIEGQTIGGQVLLADQTAALIPETLTIRATREYMPKGAREPITIYDVVAVGKDHRISDRDHEDWQDLPSPAPVSFHMLNDDTKAVEPDRYSGNILSLSGDRGYALLQSEVELTPFRNLMIDIGENLYAKVIRIREKDAVLCFTARPACFDTWISGFGI